MDTKVISDSWPTIYELATQIGQVDLERIGRPGGAKKNAAPITSGLVPEPFPIKEGYFTASPQQLASLRVPKIEVNGSVKGFQREKVNSHVRKIAKAMMEGDEMPPLIISIFPDDQAYVDDGQHRALAGIMVRRSLEVVVKRRTIDQARKLFTNQGKAKGLKSDDTLLTGDSPVELYIQDAVTSDNHPWSDLVAPYRGGTTYKMTPTTMAQMVGSFVFNAFNQGVNFYTTRPEEQFDEKLANRLSGLVRVFGGKQTNPLAFRGRSLRAIAYAATWIFRRNPSLREQDWDRWVKHMPTFDFARYPHLLTKEVDLAYALIDHWNKRLPEDRKVKPFASAHS